MDLKELAQFAVNNNNSTGASKPIHTFSIEEAREYVKVKDGNKKELEDGSQALTLMFGKHRLPLDFILQGATRVNATADKVEAFSEALLASVAAGALDSELVIAQAKAEEQFNAKSKPRTVSATVTEGVAPEAVDLEALDIGEDFEGFEAE